MRLPRHRRDGAGSPPGTATPSGGAPMSNVDVEAVLTKLAAETKEKLDWRKSIVDLMKLLKLDSSFSARARSSPKSWAIPATPTIRRR